VIGFLLGPRVTGCSMPARFRTSPHRSLALGWLGMLLGTYFRLPTMRDRRRPPPDRLCRGRRHVRGPRGAAGCVPVPAGSDWPEAAVQAATLAAVATLSRPRPSTPWWTSPLPRPDPPGVQLTARTTPGVAAFGLVLAVVHRGRSRPGSGPDGHRVGVINLAVGVASGVLFHLFSVPAATWTMDGCSASAGFRVSG
jgi:hypothetical protein